MENASLELIVSGMTCSACVRNVTRALDAIAGSGAAKVDLNSGRATVSAPAETASRLIAAVEEAGYTAIRA